MSARGTERAHRAAGAPLFWILLLIAAYFVPRGLYPNPDSHLALSYALVESHTARIDRYLSLSGTRQPLLDKAVYCGARTDVRTCRRYYSDKAPGVSLWVAAIYAALRPALPHALMPSTPGSDRFLLRMLLALLAVAAPCAAFLVALWRFLADLTGARAAMIAAVGYGFGSMALPFSTLLFSHALTAAMLFGSFILLFAQTHNDGRSGGWRPVAAGGLAGYAIGCEYPTAIIAALLGLYAIGAGRGAALRYGIGAAVGLAPLLTYNLAVFGTPLSLGYLHLTDPYYARGMAHGVLGVGVPTWQALWGTTFSPFRGIFVVSPWLLLAFPGFRIMARVGMQRESWLCAAIAATYFLFQSGYTFWDGGASVGPRHFLPALPFLVLPFACAMREPALARIGAVLVGIAAAGTALIMLTGPLYLPGSGGVPFVDQTLRGLSQGRLQNNWGMIVHLPGILTPLPLVLAIAALGRRISRRLGAHPPTVADRAA